MRAAIPLLLVLCTAPAGCGDAKNDDIEYSSNDKPLGNWPAKTSPGKAGTSGTTTEGFTMEPPTPAMDMLHLDAAVSSEADAGMDMEAPAQDPAKPTVPAAPSGGVKTAGPARLTFSVLTEVQHMRLSKGDPGFDDDARGPQNMGAIWISKPDGTFVRSLEVWRLHKERARHLQAYNKACECPKPDVTASATLNKHKLHMTSWDMTDRDHAQVPDGKYTLHIEVADYDVDLPDKPDKTAMNAVWTIDFDTHDAPKTVMPDPAQYYTNLKLELLAP